MYFTQIIEELNFSIATHQNQYQILFKINYFLSINFFILLI